MCQAKRDLFDQKFNIHNMLGQEEKITGPVGIPSREYNHNRLWYKIPVAAACKGAHSSSQEFRRIVECIAICPKLTRS